MRDKNMKRYLNASEAAKELEVSTATVSKWVNEGVFPNAFKINATIRIPTKDMEALKKPFREVT